MNCPICNHGEQHTFNLSSDDFSEQLYSCRCCNAVWSVQHDSLKMVHDPHEQTFLGRQRGNYFAT